VQNSSELSKDVKPSVESLLDYNKQNGWPDVKSQHKVIVHEYAVAGNVSDAAKAGKVTKATVSKILRDPIVRGYLDFIWEDHRLDSILTRQFVELQYLDFLDQVNGDTEVPIVTKEGDSMMAKKFDATGKLGVLRDMSKFAGMEDKSGNSLGGVSVNIDLSAFGAEKEVGVTIDGGDNTPE